MTPFKLSDLAKKINADLQGDPDCLIYRAEPLAVAKGGSISFLANAKYKSHLANTQASAVILRKEEAANCPTNALIVANPELAIAELLSFIYSESPKKSGIHPSAAIGEHCQIDETVSIAAYSVIEDGVVIKANSVIEAGCYIGKNVQIGANCRLYPQVKIYHGVRIEENTIIHSGAVIGADGFGLAHNGKKWVKMPQIGSVVIGKEVEIGANTTIDRGALQDTIIGNGVKIDNLVHIGHNVKIGDNTAIAGCAGIAGSTEIGKNCMIGGAAGITGHIKICDGVMIGPAGTVAQSIDEPGLYYSGTGVQKHTAWRRNMLRFKQLDELAKRVSQLERDKRSLGENKNATDGH